MNNINNDGYLLLKNILTQQQIGNGLKCDNNGIVCYKSMRYFIDNDFIPTIYAPIINKIIPATIFKLMK